MGVSPIAKRNGREIKPRESTVRLVQDIDADFFFDDVALVAKIFVVNLKGAHAIGFEPEDALKGIGGHGLKIVGDIVMRGAVEGAATGIDELDVLHLGSVGGALEHHMLEEVSEAAPAVRLEAKANFVVDADGNDGRGGIRGDDDFQVVGERCGFDGNLQIRSPECGFRCAIRHVLGYREASVDTNHCGKN